VQAPAAPGLASAPATDAGAARSAARAAAGRSRAEEVLAVAIGQSSQIGTRPRNEDFCGAVTPDGDELSIKGAMAAIADGLGGHEGGHEASRYAVRGLCADYYATPDSLGVPQALDRVLQSLNAWLHDYALRAREAAGRATTLSVLVLRGTRYFTAHVGDSRIYLVRDGELQRLTTDHLWDHPELKAVLKRAVGLDKQLLVDYGDGEIRTGDAFVLLTDGTWGALKESTISSILAAERDPQAAADALTRSALNNGAQDNATALVLQVLRTGRAQLRDVLVADIGLPLPPRLQIGDGIDGLQIEQIVHESRATLLYRVRRATDGAELVLKTLRADPDDPQAKAALLHEEWLARRVTSHYFPQVVPHPPRLHLYYLMSWHPGATLSERLAAGHRFTAPETVQLGIRLLKGLGGLHRLSIVHRDIKPENLHLGADGRLRILDLGVASSDGVEFAEINNPGTPSYMAPELFAGDPASVSSDLYACGVTLYQLLTRRYPYGEVEPFQNPRFGDPLPPTRFRPDIAEWLEAVLLKACARDPKERFETAEEFLLALERGAARPLSAPRRLPLARRAPGLGLRWLAALSLLANFVLLLLLLARKSG